MYERCLYCKENSTYFTITNINLLMLFKKIIAVYAGITKEPPVHNAGSMNVKLSGTYNYYSASKGLT
jgi:hypothetical protein